MSKEEPRTLEVFGFRPMCFTEVLPSKSSSDCPKPRSGHRVVCDETDLYVFGGFCPQLSPTQAREMNSDPVWAESRPLFKELWRFNLASHEWHKIACEASLPRELASSAVCMRNGVMFVYGGSGFPFGSACSNRVFAYDVRGGHGSMCEVATTGSRPPPMYGQAVLLVGPYLYAVGGTTGFEFSSDVHRLDLRTGCWEEVYVCTGAHPEEPSGRYRHDLAYDDERLFVLGGGTGDTACSLKRIHAFYMSECRWEMLQTYKDQSCGYPANRRYHGFVQRGSSAYIVGGFELGEIMGDVWRLDLVTLRWSILASCPLRRSVYFHSTAITPAGCMYSFGGVKSFYGDCTRTAEMYRAWVCVPSLEEMCREAVRHYSRQCSLFSRDNLGHCGIPRTILNTIF